MSSNDKQLVIHFNNGTKMEVAFPQQIKNSMGAMVEALKRLLESDKLVIEGEQQIFVIPWSNIQYIHASGVPAAALPLGCIKGATVTAPTATTP